MRKTVQLVGYSHVCVSRCTGSENVTKKKQLLSALQGDMFRDAFVGVLCILLYLLPIFFYFLRCVVLFFFCTFLPVLFSLTPFLHVIHRF